MENKVKWAPGGEADTPYRRARQEWDFRMGGAVLSARNWRLACFSSLGLLGFALGGMAYLGAKPKAVPHIIQVDAIGQPTYLGPAGESATGYVPTDIVLKYHLRRFLEDTRGLSSDTQVVKEHWIEAYHLVTGRGAAMLTDFIRQPGNDPFKRTLEGFVSVEVATMVRVSADTWQIDWKEVHFSKGGDPEPPVVWRGMFRIVVEPPQTEEAMKTNPVGLYIDEFHWDKVSG